MSVLRKRVGFGGDSVLNVLFFVVWEFSPVPGGGPICFASSFFMLDCMEDATLLL